MKASIVGIGQWLPEQVRENSDYPPEFVERSRDRRADRTLVDIPIAAADACQRIAARHLAEEAADPFLGSTRRRVAAPETTASQAEADAARVALKDAGIAAAEIDVILSWAIVPDRISPSNACRVGCELGADRAWCMGVDAACASVVTQLTMAAALIESGRARTVLLTQSHIVTRAMPILHPASPNVGDAAGAIVVSATERPGIRTTLAATDGRYCDAVTWCRGRTPDSDPPWWLPGGGYYLGSLEPRAAQQLMQDTVRIARDTIRELMAQARAPLESIELLASVQPRRWVPAAIAEGLGIEPERAPQTFDEYAHLGGVGVVANLLAGRAQGRLRPGTRVVLYAQGAGFTRAAALLDW